MQDFDKEFKFEFVCLCCGGRNGEVLAACSINKYPLDRTEDINKIALEDRHMHLDILAWLDSPDYKGSVIIPVGYNLTDEARRIFLRLTDDYRKKHRNDNCVMLFKLPVIKEKLPNVVDLTEFLN